MMKKILSFCFLATYLFVFSVSALPFVSDKEFSLRLTAEEWEEIGDPSHFRDDLIILRDGSRIEGKIQSVPPLIYSFTKVSFELEEMAAVAVSPSTGKIQYVTRNGQNFIGKIPRYQWKVDERIDNASTGKGSKFLKKTSYQEKIVDPKEINFVFFKQRGLSRSLVHEKFMSVLLDGGDRFPVIADTHVIRLTDGWKDFDIRTDDIRELWYNGGLQGYLSGEGMDRELPFSFVKDRYFPIRLAKNNQKFKIPWKKIDRIIADMGELVIQTPYLFKQWSPQNMVFVPQGRFLMGSVDYLSHQTIAKAPPILSAKPMSNALKQRVIHGANLVPTVNAPTVLVELPGFFIDKYEVTNDQYKRFVDATGHRAPAHWHRGKLPKGTGAFPVVNVSYKDAQAYARWAKKRLPTEAEWERAAKGMFGDLYPYGKEYDPILANVATAGSVAVGSFEVILGERVPINGNFSVQVQDLSGNVAEWTNTSFRSDLYQVYEGKAQVYRPDYQDRRGFRVIRGGSFRSSSSTATTVYRSSMHEDDFNNYTGFRCVADGIGD